MQSQEQNAPFRFDAKSTEVGPLEHNVNEISSGDYIHHPSHSGSLVEEKIQLTGNSLTRVCNELVQNEKLRSMLLELVNILRNVIVKESSNEFDNLNQLLKVAASDTETLLTIRALFFLFEDVKNSIQVSRDKSGFSQEESRYERESQQLRQHALNAFHGYIKNNNYNDRVVASFINLFWELFAEFEKTPEIVKFFNDAGMYIKDSLECPNILGNKVHNDIVRNLNARAMKLFSVSQNKETFELIESTLCEAESLLNLLNDQQAKQKGKEIPRAFNFNAANVHHHQRQPPDLWHSKEQRKRCQEVSQQQHEQHFDSLSSSQQQPPLLWTEGTTEPELKREHTVLKQQVLEILKPIVLENLKQVSVPKVQGSVENNRFHFTLDDMTMSFRNIDDNQISSELFPESNNLVLKLSISHLASQITNAHYEFYEKSNPKLVNGGVANIDVAGMTIRTKWTSPLSPNFHFSLVKARCKVGSTHANIRDAKQNWLMILVSQLLEGEVKDHLERAVEACLIDSLTDIENKLNNLNLQKTTSS